VATTLEEELSPPCLDGVDDYFCLAEEEAEFQDLEQEVKPETSLVELKQVPPGLQYVFLNGYSLKELKGISPSLCTHHISKEQERKPICEHQ
jgi:hypothetical protein